MRKFRGVIALCVSLCLAFLASYSVYSYLEQPDEQSVRQAEVPVKKEPPPPPKPGLTETVPPGMRAITIRVDKIEGAPLELNSGDLVDVIVVGPLPVSKIDARVSRVLFEAIKVLKADMYNVPSKMRPVTLLVTPEQGSTLSAAAHAPGSAIRLAIRNPNDTKRAGVPPKGFLLGDGETEILNAQNRDIDSIVPPGMRAVILGGGGGIGGKFRAGDHVDIVVTCPFARAHKTDDHKVMIQTEMVRNSKIWRQNVRILAVYEDFRKRAEKQWDVPSDEPEEAEDGKEESMTEEEKKRLRAPRKVAVALSPEDAEKLLALLELSKGANVGCRVIQLLARHPDDHEVVETEGVQLETLLGKKRLFKKVDQFRGPLRKTQKFYKNEEEN